VNAVSVEDHARMIIDRTVELTPRLANRSLLQKGVQILTTPPKSSARTRNAEQRRPGLLRCTPHPCESEISRAVLQFAHGV
jgi:hypothetical protein